MFAIYVVTMTIYLYDDATGNYIGELKTVWIKEQILPGMIIFFQKIKYIVVSSKKQADPNTFTVTVNRV